MQDFRHIKAWQRAHALAIALHKRAHNFSRLGYSRLRAQLTAAADSIGDTIMEGAGAATAARLRRSSPEWDQGASQALARPSALSQPLAIFFRAGAFIAGTNCLSTCHCFAMSA